MNSTSLVLSLLSAWSIAPQDAPPAELPIVPFPADHPLHAALVTICADDLKDSLEWLASDDRKGRCAGEKSNDEAAAWIAGRFEEMGLAPIGDDGSYLQHFDFAVRGADGGQTARTQNVVGMIRGSDPELAGETIVLGAHFDHVGTADSFDAGRIGGPAGNDRIWNGADDNASGSSTLIEVAEAFALSDTRPARSLVFVAFSAEEQGLYGSAHFVSDIPAAAGKVVAMVNMDMVGRNPELPVEMAALGSLENELWMKLIAASRGSAPSLTFKFETQSRPDSDHASFVDHGIPATFLFTGMHPEYHTARDHADKIAFDHMAEVAKFATALAWNTANCREPMKFAQPRFFPGGQKRLGIDADGALEAEDAKKLGVPDGQGGFVVHNLQPGGVGSKAGLQDGDVIVEIREKTLDPSDPATSLRRLIGGAPRGKPFSIVVLRGGERVTLEAQFE